MMIITIKNANQCEVDGPLKVVHKLYNEFKIKHPNAWHIQMYQRGNNKWDGYIKYINDYGIFRIGLLPKVYETLISWGEEVKIIDRRPKLSIEPNIPKSLGSIDLYPRQIEALNNLLNNKVGGTPFLICVGDYAVGFGKSLLFCAIHESFHRQIPTILLLNDSDLFDQFKREIPPLLPNENIAFIRGGKVSSWGNFNVAMVQSVSQNLNKYAYELSKIGIVLIDEADIIDNKTYKSVIEHLYNTRVRIGLSGTIYMDNSKKNMVHNMNIMQFIGNKVDQVKLSDQIKNKKATPVVVKMVVSHIEPKKKVTTYLEEYGSIISNNIEAYKISFTRTQYNTKYGRLPALIVTKYINHCENLYKYYKERSDELGLGFNIAYVHHKTPNREKILNDFRNGNIDILISTTIISRGKNFPDLRYLQNTACIDSNEKSIQILGRLVRQSSSKNKAYLDDIVFPGHYLLRHSEHRKIYYQRENLKVILVDGIKNRKTKSFNKVESHEK